ncbi:lipopolysaccharide biosynthesis protein [Alkalimonas amylolytica]|uniref:Membrane protein involved in the export of O-antigen and teichoic acid n=1 Tax=Alkalimonas amylolytica TaxID=152573 RepID=A0A1H4CCR6_ALKAM|nr:lipopolysaccharide biosynthesis protein [Alkalimonas amylolytica]SEA58154.1 Membrane protein involved in the export of O-antigen and teichoic acid [Alkalimonas amylolytica]
MSEQSLGRKVTSGSLWTLLVRWASRLLGIISVIIIARVLLPEDYGLIAKAIMFSSFIQLMTEFGLLTSLVRNKNSTVDDYNTVWTLSLIRGLLLGLVIAATAGFWAGFFDEPEIYPVIFAYAGVAVFHGVMNVGIVDFQREMRFDREFRFNIAARLSEFLVTVSIALIYKSYWAFPIGSLVGALVKVILSYAMSSFRPRLSLISFEKVFNFSKWFFVYESLKAVSIKLDTFLLSKLSSTESLGLYTVSKEIAGMPSTEIAMPVARASLPALAKLVDEKVAFQKLYTTILASVLFLAIPAAVGLSLLADFVILLLLGPNWAGAAFFLQILAFVGITRVNVACAVSALAAVGRADLLGRYSFYMLIIKSIALTIGIHLNGAEGLVWGVLISSLIGMAVIQLTQRGLGLLNFKLLYAQIWRVLCATLIMVLVLLLFREIPLIKEFGVVGWLSIPLTLIGVLVYALSLTLLCFLSRWPEGPEKELFNLTLRRFTQKWSG